MAGRTIEIKLARPLKGHAGPVTKVVLREPTYDEYMRLGDPFLVALSPDSKIPFAVEDKAALAEYCRILIVEPDGLIVEQGGFALARQITAGVRSFFRDGSEAAGGSGTSRTNSPSASARTATP